MNQDSPSRAALEKAQPAQEASRRQEVLRAAVEVFSHQGYHGASMEDIARIVGVRKPALYYYFPSKQDLLFASLDQFTQRMVDGLEEIYSSSARPADKLRQTFYFHITAIARYTSDFTVLLSEFKYLKSRRKKQIIARRDRYEGMVRKMIEDGIDDGTFRPVDAKFAAIALLAVVNWMYHWYRDGQLQPEELASRFWDLYFSGLGAMPGPPPA